MGKEDQLDSSSEEPREQRTYAEKDTSLGAWLQVVGAFCLYFNTWGDFAVLVDVVGCMLIALNRFDCQLWHLSVVL